MAYINRHHAPKGQYMSYTDILVRILLTGNKSSLENVVRIQQCWEKKSRNFKN